MAPLQFALTSGRPEMVTMLLENGADANITDVNGNTLLHLALLQNRKKMAEILIQNFNCDVNAKNYNGQSVLQLIQRNSPRFTDWCNFQKLYEESLNRTYQKCTSTSIQDSNSMVTEDSYDDQAVNFSDRIRSYASSGLKTSLHGTVYQLQPLMLFVYRAHKNNYAYFDIATELDIAEKFDDVVITYKRTAADKLYTWRFLQAKHKQDVKKQKITVSGLTNDDKGEFSLQKYFLSFCKIQSNPAFQNANFEEVDLCTNTSLDFGLNKRKIDGTLTVAKQKINDDISKWKNYFTEDKIAPDEMLYFKENRDIIIKHEFKTDLQVKDELLKCMKTNLLEKVLVLRCCRDFPCV
ncbi:uncharacterized protein [Diabrotica undecimpunctata]|uniref:uncharacterized protein n=1 Tax=Diabrotica undecimpunctata TaxID=50387 RepID=UPI003B63C761